MYELSLNLMRRGTLRWTLALPADRRFQLPTYVRRTRSLDRIYCNLNRLSTRALWISSATPTSDVQPMFDLYHDLMAASVRFQLPCYNAGELSSLAWRLIFIGCRAVPINNHCYTALMGMQYIYVASFSCHKCSTPSR
jgi:hypothetical protein